MVWKFLDLAEFGLVRSGLATKGDEPVFRAFVWMLDHPIKVGTRVWQGVAKDHHRTGILRCELAGMW